MENANLIKKTTSWFRGSNTGSGEAYFSIKRRKFIKPRIRWGAETVFNYMLYPGTYILLSWSYWNKREPPHRVKAYIVKVKEDGNVEWISEAVWEVYSTHEFDNPILADFFAARPCYHCSPGLDFNKAYSEEDVNWLLEKIRKKQSYVEGIEYE